ncbi:MAG: 2OG-Fe(II) oxygenase [Cyclobacteriaceae bacterium]
MNWDEKIADGLAEEGIVVVDEFLSMPEVREILSLPLFREPENHMRYAGIGHGMERQVNEAIRGDMIKWLDRRTAPPPVAAYLSRIESLIQYLNRNLFLSLKDYEIHATAYPPGTFYKRHLDQFKRDDHRKLSVICYLNPDWQSQWGGQLRIFGAGEPRDIIPIAGRLVCFRSDQIEHEVLPATALRRSLTGWLLDQLSDLRKL